MRVVSRFALPVARMSEAAFAKASAAVLKIGPSKL
jgi:hypothetical protein